MKDGLYQIIKEDDEEITFTDRFIELLPCYSLSYSRSRFLRLNKRVENDKTLLLKMVQHRINNSIETTNFSLERDGIFPYIKILDKPIGTIDEKDIINVGLISNEEKLHYSRYNGYSYSRGFSNNTDFKSLNKNQILGLVHKISGQRFYTR